MFTSIVNRDRSPCVDLERRTSPPRLLTVTDGAAVPPTRRPALPHGKKKKNPPTTANGPNNAPVAAAASGHDVPGSRLLRTSEPSSCDSSTSHYSSCNESGGSAHSSRPHSPWLTAPAANAGNLPSPRSRSPSPFFDALGRLSKRLRPSNGGHSRQQYHGSRHRLDMSQAQSSSWDMVYFIAGKWRRRRLAG